MLGIARSERDRPSIHRICGGNLRELVTRVRAAAKGGGRILVCYEAGYDGFWIARSLAVNGAAIFLKSGAAKFPILAGWRSAMGVIGASVLWRTAATLQG